VSPMQARLSTLPGQRHLPPPLHDDRALGAREARVTGSPQRTRSPRGTATRPLQPRRIASPSLNAPQKQCSDVNNPTRVKDP
jgi:hypothetical protein